MHSQWQGANVLSKQERKKQSLPGGETVEAALNRLSKAYAASMECVAAWHRASSSNDKNVLVKVARAARQAFEDGILHDPLVEPYAVAFLDSATEARGRNHRLGGGRRAVNLTSEAHKSTVRQLSYLSLVNYSDLLLAGCGKTQSTSNQETMLDRGVVPPLQAFESSSCWEEETETETVRRALKALLDATRLDGSDPVVWLKLACLTRRLGRLVDETAPPALLPFRRLEKFALEEGLLALPKNLPPNRMLVKAHKEWCSELLDVPEYPEKLSKADDVCVPIELHRYSWSTLGRTLLRVCREGDFGHVADKKDAVAMPRLSLKMSQMLVLPSAVLARVCQFLQEPEIRSFEATCRALSYAIVSARTISVVDYKDSGKGKKQQPVSSQAPVKSNEPGGTTEEEQKVEGGDEKCERQQQRISKRLRTQLITEGKRSERSSRRTSADYCLLAAILGCIPTDKNYMALIEEGIQWNDSKTEKGGEEGMDESRRSESGVRRIALTDKRDRHRQEAKERSGDASIAAFLASVNVATPINTLFCFVAHVSKHIADVFSSDAGGAMTLSSSLLDCYDLMMRRSQMSRALVSSWYGGDLIVPAGAGLSPLDLFAIDLLHAELRLRRCDREEQVDSAFDSDGNFVSTIVQSLLDGVQHLDTVLRDNLEWVGLKVRCYWLLAVFYFWRGRISHNVSESRQAEKEGLGFLQETIACLSLPQKRPIIEVRTPHLDSPSRSGPYWKVISVPTLTIFRDEIQASSVVLLAQEQFLEAVSRIRGHDDDENGIGEGSASLIAIGDSLLKRYDTPIDSPDAKQAEVVEDFVAVHGETLLNTGMEMESSVDGDTGLRLWFNEVVPSGAVDRQQLLALSRNSSILSILVACLQVDSNHLAVAKVCSQMACAVVVQCEKVLADNTDGKDDPSMNDDESSGSSEIDWELGHESSMKKTDELKLRQYGTLLQLLIERTQSVLKEGDLLAFLALESAPQLFRDGLLFCSDRFKQLSSCQLDESGTQDDKIVFDSLRRFYQMIECSSSSSNERFLGLSAEYIRGLMKIVIEQRRTLDVTLNSSSDRQSRVSRQKLVKRRCKLLSDVCCELGRVLSLSLSKVGNRTIAPTHVFLHPTLLSDLQRSLPLLCESLLWLWKTSKKNELSMKERLQIPVAVAIVGLCGSATNAKGPYFGDNAGTDAKLDDFYDSDASALDWSIDETDGQESQDGKDLLRVLSQAIHCVDNVFGCFDDNEIQSFRFCDHFKTSNGPLLPLVVVRVLNLFADRLLLDFPEEGERAELWGDYPYGTRSSGTLLDSLLYKAYRSLHGFTLVNTNDSKDVPATAVKPQGTRYLPENVHAAAALYRCILRAYSQGRKSPPKAALEAVLDALPPLAESTKSRALRDFLFSATTGAEVDVLSAFVDKVSSEEGLARGFDWGESFSKLGAVEEHEKSDELDDEAMIVRKGISNLVAQGPLPTSQEGMTDYDERTSSSLVEAELSRKFYAIIDSLSLGDPSDFEGWYKAAQCLISKADLIADRIGLTRGFSRCHNFIIPERLGLSACDLSLQELLEEQDRDAQSKTTNWLSHLGNDLSLYVRKSWSSFDSLQSCAAEVTSSCLATESGNDQTSDGVAVAVCKELVGLHDRKEFVRWQNAWGGLFVSSIRILAARCFGAGLFFASKQTPWNKDDRVIISEMCESLGALMYSSLSGAQVYGYPMHAMSDKERRQVAERCLKCFRGAVKLTGGSTKNENRSTWDLKFMIGKCHEKIAGTYSREKFHALSDSKPCRQYETHMQSALQMFADSLEEARETEKEGHMTEQSGGSSHGATEVLYRLHATRLKCIIAGVDRPEAERDSAEHEGLRLSERHWYKEPDDKPSSLRDRVWEVFCDIVSALVQCRLEQSFFHRSVFRHAQALMWAPVLCDPTQPKGSLGSVPMTHAFKVRGLNSSTPVSESGATVIGHLFGKKRTQLCAVWVTSSSSPSTFQSINSNVRKYDSLRGKYIAAYLESLRLCNKRSDVETFLKWSLSCQRDLPSFFAASALTKGSAPKKPHADDCLLVDVRCLTSFHFLTTVKRQANCCLAAVISHEMQQSTSSANAENESFLKSAYACFLRLNCTPDALIKSPTWKYHHRSSAGTIGDVVESLTAAYLRMNKDKPLSGPLSDWSGESQTVTLLKAALTKCKTQFPNLSGTFYSKQKRSPKKKRKEKLVKKSFDVTVPAGLKAGDSFVVNLEVQGEQRKIRLTVPDSETPVQVMRFSLQVPEEKEDDDEQDRKRQKTASETDETNKNP